MDSIVMPTDADDDNDDEATIRHHITAPATTAATVIPYYRNGKGDERWMRFLRPFIDDYGKKVHSKLLETGRQPRTETNHLIDDIVQAMKVQGICLVNETGTTISDKQLRPKISRVLTDQYQRIYQEEQAVKKAMWEQLVQENLILKVQNKTLMTKNRQLETEKAELLLRRPALQNDDDDDDDDGGLGHTNYGMDDPFMPGVKHQKADASDLDTISLTSFGTIGSGLLQLSDKDKYQKADGSNLDSISLPSLSGITSLNSGLSDKDSMMMMVIDDDDDDDDDSDMDDESPQRMSMHSGELC